MEMEIFDRISGLELSSDRLSSLEYDLRRDLPYHDEIVRKMNELKSKIHSEKLAILKRYIVNKSAELGGVYYKPSGNQISPEKLYEDILEFWDRYAVDITFTDMQIIVSQRGGVSRVYEFGVADAIIDNTT